MRNIWNIIQQSEEAVSIMKTFYDLKGIYEIRVLYAAWIEDRLTKESLSTTFEEAVYPFYNDLKEKIRISTEFQSNDSLLLYERIDNIEALTFYKHLNEGIAMELELTGTKEPNFPQLLMQLLIVSCNEFYQIPYLRFATKMNQGFCHHQCNDPISFLLGIFRKYLDVKSFVLEELKNWQIRQIQIASANDKDQINYLNQIQIYYEQLFELTSKMLQLTVEYMQSLAIPDERIKQLAQEIEIHYNHLLVNSFIVEKQPKRVVTKKRNFTASVRWLIGSKLGLIEKIDVHCMVISDAQAKTQCAERYILNKNLPKPTNELTGSTSSMLYQKETSSYSANFGLEFETSNRVNDEKGSKGVLAEKLALLFYLEMTVNGFSFYIKTLSLPIVLVVHGNQEYQAWATIVWDNAFLQIGREFDTPQTVSWAKLSKAMNDLFVSITGREYTRENEYFLYEKLFQTGTVMNPEAKVYWEKFCKEPLSGCNFSFWEWFYYTAKLIKNCFRDLWEEQLIEGYISKKDTENNLISCRPGTFLLRFSERTKGAITISHVNANQQIEHLIPWDSKFFANDSLAEQIKKIEFITTLYPHGIDKHTFPSKIKTEEEKADLSGYVGLVTYFKRTYVFGNWLKKSAKNIFMGHQRRKNLLQFFRGARKKNSKMNKGTTWNTVQSSEKAKSIMKIFYDRMGIFDIRVLFATWIEERFVNEFQLTTLEQVALPFYNDLKEHIRISTQFQSNDIYLLNDRMNNIEAIPFYRHLTEGILLELQLIGTNEPNYLQLLMEQLIRSCNEFYQIPFLRFATNMNQGLSHDECYDPNKFLIEMFENYLEVKSSVLEQLKNWQIRQIQIDTDERQLNYLNHIQIWFEYFYELTSKMLQLVDELMRSHAIPDDERLKQLAQQIVKHQKHLLVNSFIVEIQPKRVITKNRKVKTSVRWLIGSKLGLKEKIDVGCTIISDAQAKTQCANRHILTKNLPEPRNKLHNISSMQYQTKSNSYSANFILEFENSIRVGAEKGSENVLAEKLVLLFYLEMTVNKFSFYLKTLSLPIVLVVHGSQECQAWATIVWDNAFLQIGREFETPQTVSWSKLSKAINTMLVSFTGRGYTQQNEYFLYEKLFQNRTVVNPEAEVYWGMFCKEHLPECDFSFFEWFYYTAKLIRDCFPKLWQQHFIEGFISKKNTENNLMFCYPGTFLLRFSERKKGAISISHVNANQQIEHLMPWESTRFSNNSLVEQIKQVKCISTLFPTGIDKHTFPSEDKDEDKKKNNQFLSTMLV